jgi:hypothetical protein
VGLDGGGDLGDLDAPPDERGQRHRQRPGRRGAAGSWPGRRLAAGAIAHAVVVAAARPGAHRHDRPRRRVADVAARHPVAPLGRERSHQPSEGPPIGDTELAQQRRDMALDGAHRHEEPGGDLRVGGALGDQLEHLCLALGYAGIDELRGDHAPILPGEAARADAF